MNTNQRNPKKTDSDPQSSLTEIFNSFFAQNPGSVKMRLFFSVFCLFGIWVLLVFSSSSFLDEISLQSTFPTDSNLSAFLGFFFNQFINPLVLTRLIVVAIAYITALHFSGQYLKTIYQIKSGRSARNILVNLAFGLPLSDSVFIEDGQIASISKNSPILSFGGPGKVKIGFDSGVLLERIDGIAEIIGPTENLSDGYLILKPFEKIRKIFNLKSHTLSFDLLVRTNDGIPLRIKDIRLTFSILRGTNKVTLTKPYPFSSQAIYWLVFHQPNIEFFDLIANITKTILFEVIRENDFIKIFPFSGSPFIIHNNNDHNSILNQESRKGKRLLASRRKKSLSSPKKSKFSQTYLSRPILHHPHHPYTERNQYPSDSAPTTTISHRQLSSTLINKFAQEFSNHLQQPGIKFEWVSLGTWTPIFSSSLIKPTRIFKTSLTGEVLPNMNENQRSKKTQHLIEEFFGDSEHYIESQTTRSDSNFYLKKILQFLKMNSATNKIRSRQNQDILEKAIMKLERNLKENL